MTQELRRLAEAYPMEYDPMGKSGKENLQRCLSYNAFHAAANPAAILSLLDRLEKAEKDAARLDWLNLAGNRFAFHLSGTWYSRKDHGSPYRKHKNIRLAIDAAMEASK